MPTDYFFSAAASDDLYVSICPVWYYVEYNYIYRIFNLIRESSLNLLQEGLEYRLIFEFGRIYLGQKEEERKRLEG